MKRKQWSELEEQTLLTKYADMLNSTLSKLKTREKMFKPIADQINSVHHLQDPINFPFKWSWRDVSIKVQNMGKIKISDNKFDWNDGQNHRENFLKYKWLIALGKQMIQMHADARQNRLQILGAVARLLCQLFGTADDGLGTLPPQVLQNLLGGWPTLGSLMLVHRLNFCELSCILIHSRG